MQIDGENFGTLPIDITYGFDFWRLSYLYDFNRDPATILGLGLDFEADGFYASSAFFNGATAPFEGWIWDASLSVKTRFAPRSSAFLAVRSIGGGANGSDAYPGTFSTKSTNPETHNALATLAVTLGLSIE